MNKMQDMIPSLNYFHFYETSHMPSSKISIVIMIVLLPGVLSEYNKSEIGTNNSQPSVGTRGYTIDDCTCVCGKSESRSGAIVGGVEARPSEFPWIVALLRDTDKFFCGGTLITRYHVMTAAHCLEGISENEITILLGEHDRTNPLETATEVRSLVAATPHETFDAVTYDNDIAVLELDSAVEFTSSIRPACLPSPNDHNEYARGMSVVVGWGRLGEEKELSNVLQKVELPILNLTKCRELSGENEVTDNMICTGFEKGEKDACTGDSGGPLHLDGEVIGIVSWGEGCARPNTPGVFTKVVNYIDWIKKHIDDECLCPAFHNFARLAEVILSS